MLDLKSLRNELAFIDLSVQRAAESSTLERLIVRKENLKVKMYQEAKHPRPHLHVDYGARNHVAAYAIDTGEKLVGNLPSIYDKAISAWIEQNRDMLNTIWLDLQSGRTADHFIEELTAI